MTQEDRLEKIVKLDSDGLQAYLEATHRSTLGGKEKTELIEACENKLSRLNRDNALVIKSDPTDAPILND